MSRESRKSLRVAKSGVTGVWELSNFLAYLETDHANIVLVPALIERLEGKPNSKDPSTFRIDLKEKNGKNILIKSAAIAGQRG